MWKSGERRLSKNGAPRAGGQGCEVDYYARGIAREMFDENRGRCAVA